MSTAERAASQGLEVLHIYGQEAWHDDVRIVGNRAALESLQSLIAVALEKGKAQADSFFVADGEGYGVIVECNDEDWQSPAWQELAVPYSRDYAR